MYGFKFIDQLQLDTAGNNIGPVPIAAFLEEAEQKISVSYSEGGLVLTTLTALLVSDSDPTFNLLLSEDIASSSTGNLLLGHTSKKLKATVPENSSIFDLLTHKPFLDYEEDDPNEGIKDIYISPEVLDTKILGYTEYNSFANKTLTSLITWSSRYPFSVSSTGLDGSEGFPVAEATYASLDSIADPLEIYIAKVNDASNWKVYFKNTAVISNNDIITVKGGEARSPIVTEDSPKFLTDRLLKLSHKGIADWDDLEHLGMSLKEEGFCSEAIYPTEADCIAHGTCSNPAYSTETTCEAASATWIPFGWQSTSKILTNTANITIRSVNKEEGLILLDKAAPKDITFSYLLDDEWNTLKNINLNPMSGELPSLIKMKILNEGSLFYSIDTTEKYVDATTGTFDQGMQSTIARFPVFATINITSQLFSHIDTRVPGGVQIDTTSIDSHTTYGFMGVNPSQRNISIVALPDSVLDLLIAQYKDLHIDPTAGDNLSTLSEKVNYIQNFTSTAYDSETGIGTKTNLIEGEVMKMVHRYLSAGVLAIVVDSFYASTYSTDNIIFKD
jgi:hypothetical protein|tara:strand:- start:995 stop:2671 length:1677 start_codon:yes stop_codon:yes gene_type:complete